MAMEHFVRPIMQLVSWISLLWYFMLKLKGKYEYLKDEIIQLKHVFEDVKEMEILKVDFKDAARGRLRRATVAEKAMEKTVGLELMVEEVWRCIEDPNLHTIGLYGLAGVGKTTLLKKTNNEFLNRSSHGFEAVIWLSVSKQPDLEKIQEEILKDLQIPDGIWQNLSMEEKARIIYRIFKKKKCVLLLDDIRKPLNLVELGVLNHDQDVQKGSKVVFTTRILDICCQMDAEPKIKVECLPPEPALALFRMKVGKDTLTSPGISELAEIMAAICGGFPLALVTVGRAMAGRTNSGEWEHEISRLMNSPSQFPGMNHVFSLLKFSLDGLDNDLHKSCFLYCSQFPIDCNIKKEQLIQRWIEEFGSNVRNSGEFIIGNLKRACLLETGNSEDVVTMHELIRGMALEEWRSQDQG